MVSNMDRMPDRRVTLALAALLALGAWPFLAGLDLWPMAPDSGLWIARGAPTDPEWAQWVFGTRHFHVGYRPVTALSYTLNHALGGLAPLPYRVTDLALHLTAAVAVFAVSRRLFRDASPWAAVFAAGLFLAHPAIEQAVPYIARRSYALSTALALAGLATWLGPRRRPASPASMRPIAAGALFALALLANEVAVLPIATLPLLAWLRAGPEPRRVQRWASELLAPGVLLLAALVIRLWVVGGIGGYETEATDSSRFLPVFAAAWRAAAGLPTPLEPDALPVQWLLLAATLPYYVLRCLAGPPARRILGLWIVATALLFALQDVWFPRQGYVLAIPVALLAANVLFETLREPLPRARRLLELAPQVILFATLLAGSAVVRGPDAQRTREWAWRDALIDDLVTELATVEDGSDVHAVLPFRRSSQTAASLKGDAAKKLLPRGARQPVTWVKLLLGERDVRLQEFAYVLRVELEQLAPPTLDTTVAPPMLVLPEQREYLIRAGARWIPFAADTAHRIPFMPPIHAPDRPVFAYLAGVSGGDLIPLE